MKTNPIGPMDQLQNGTKVRVRMKVGHVISSEIVDAVPSGKIVVHTIEYTHRVIRWPSRRTMRLPKTERQTVNYSFINVIEEND